MELCKKKTLTYCHKIEQTTKYIIKMSHYLLIGDRVHSSNELGRHLPGFCAPGVEGSNHYGHDQGQGRSVKEVVKASLK